ncbi:hypothetical protein GCM10022409_09170 [Hymenobacter glaciei]|uniref:STAS domain-containing protein n=1 Tax=Hymenobacter glaciei TaxID=877209 RepID=A0ABP7TJX6_9BACT
MSKPLLLAQNHSAPLRYQLRTTTAIQVGERKFENELLYVVEQQLHPAQGLGYLLEINVQHTMQKADDLMSRVVADVNQASRRLLVQTDLHGNLLRVENQEQVLAEWELLRQPLLKKYEAQPEVKPFFEAFGQQLAIPGSLEPNLRYKGVLGALLPGLYGYAYGPQEPAVLTSRRITGFFNTLDLPLLLTSQQGLPAAGAPTGPANLHVTTTGALDDAAFAHEDFRRMIRDLVDDFKFPVDLEIDCTGAHTFDAASGALLHAQQVLRAEVAGIYHNSTIHDVVVQQPA